MDTPSTYSLTLTAEQIDLVGKALGKLPVEESLALWLHLKGQVAMQQLTFAKNQTGANTNDNPVSSNPGERGQDTISA